MIEVLKSTGMNEVQLKKLHQEFEKRYPAEHEEFLIWLGLNSVERIEIRNASR